jgi:hypothetical protein
MNFLQICQRVRSETGVSGDGPANVAGQVGIYKKIVDWVQAAHEEIQLRSTNWRFDWAEHSVALVNGTEKYLPSDVWSLNERSWDYDSLYVYKTSEGPQSRTFLSRVDYNTYRQMRLPAVSGTPIYVSMSPDKALNFYPIPSDGVMFVGDYYKDPMVMVNSTDTPRMPSDYHMAIVWRAVMHWSASEENPALFQTASANYRSLMLKMETTELDGPMEAEPLA